MPPPLAILAAADVRLAQMIQYERLVGKVPREGDGGGQLSRVDQDVVGQPVPIERREAAAERRPFAKAVRLALHDVTDAREAVMMRDALELLLDADRLQVHPADDTGDDRMAIRQFEQPAGFFRRLTRLDRDGRLHSGRRHVPSRIDRREVTLQRPHRLGDTAVLTLAVDPIVLVGIDHQPGGLRPAGPPYTLTRGDPNPTP